MKAMRLLPLVLALALLATAAVAAGAPASKVPTNNGCQVGGDYDPACDLNHDGHIDLQDIQLAAGHWGQDGTWTSDHNHLGETWIGTTNPLVISGTFGAFPTGFAPLVLRSSQGAGLVVESAAVGLWLDDLASDGILVDHADDDGIDIGFVEGDGVSICSTGTTFSCVMDGSNNGVEIGNAQNSGVLVHHAGDSGLYVDSAGDHGVYIDSVDGHGVLVNSADGHGLYVGSTQDDGVYVLSTAADGIGVSFATNDGMAVSSAGNHGVSVYSAGQDGVNVYSASDDGVYVRQAGSPSFTQASSSKNGFEVAGAQGYGLYVGRANLDGIYVNSTAWHGLNVVGATVNGVYVTGAGNNAVDADTANVNGQWGVYTPDKISSSSLALSSLTVIAQVTGEQGLNPGDVAMAVGVTDPLPGSTIALALVQPASSGSGVVGVVEARMALTPKPQREDGLEREPVLELRSAEGPAMPGDYVALTVLGVAQVKVDASASIQPGQRLTASEERGAARALKTVEIDGVRLAEDAPAIGIALAAPMPGQETIPVFVTLR